MSDKEASTEKQALDYALKLTDFLYDSHYLAHLPTRMTASRSTYHQGGRGGYPHRITYGVQTLLNFYQQGYWCTQRELRYVWVEETQREAKGFEAVWRLVLHEFAHVIQVNRKQRFKGGLHNWYYMGILRDLVRGFPFWQYGPERFTEQKGDA